VADPCGGKEETAMKRYALTALVLSAGITLAAGTGAYAQTAQKLAGTWKLMSATVTLDGKSRDIFGPQPTGMMMFDPAGRFTQVIIASGLPKFASKSREKGTVDENLSVVKGSIAYFGTYSLAPGGIVNLHVESSTFPNMTDTDQKRSIKFSGDELTWGNATPAVGAGIAEQVWKRAQ
jgi:hypothetical protein